MAGFIHLGFRQNLESCPGNSSCWHWARWAHLACSMAKAPQEQRCAGAVAVQLLLLVAAPKRPPGGRPTASGSAGTGP